MQVKGRVLKWVCCIVIVAVFAATDVWAEDDIVPFDPSRSIVDGLTE